MTTMEAVLTATLTFNPATDAPRAPAATPPASASMEREDTYSDIIDYEDYMSETDLGSMADAFASPTPPPLYPAQPRAAWPPHAAPQFVPPRPAQNPPPPCAAQVLECSYSPVSQSTTHLWRAMDGNLYLSTTMALPTPPHVAARPL